jgi:hypothetical protein
MANKNPPELSDFFIEGRPLSRAVFEKPEHVADVLKYFGLQRQSTLRKIIQELDMTATDYRVALKNRPPQIRRGRSHFGAVRKFAPQGEGAMAR